MQNLSSVFGSIMATKLTPDFLSYNVNVASITHTKGISVWIATWENVPSSICVGWRQRLACASAQSGQSSMGALCSSYWSPTVVRELVKQEFLVIILGYFCSFLHKKYMLWIFIRSASASYGELSGQNYPTLSLTIPSENVLCYCIVFHYRKNCFIIY